MFNKLKQAVYKIVIIVALLAAGSYLEAQTVAPSDLQQMQGMWTGHLTYTDYKDDVSQTKLDCELTVNWKNKKGIFNLTFIEPNGQIYKDKTKVKLIKRGTQLKFDGKYKIVEFSKSKENPSWELTLGRNGKDNNKDAELKLVIGFSQNQLIMTKFVKYDGSNDFFIRNSYTFDRKNKKQINGEKQ